VEAILQQKSAVKKVRMIPTKKKKHPKRGDGEPAIPIMLLTVSLSYAVSRLNSKFIQYMHAK
jgi:hypothetical protein